MDIYIYNSIYNARIGPPFTDMKFYHGPLCSPSYCWSCKASSHGGFVVGWLLLAMMLGKRSGFLNPAPYAGLFKKRELLFKRFRKTHMFLHWFVKKGNLPCNICGYDWLCALKTHFSTYVAHGSFFKGPLFYRDWKNPLVFQDIWTTCYQIIYQHVV